MRTFTPILCTVMAALLVSTTAQAQSKPKAKPSQGKSTPTTQTYKWVDENGVTHYGDSVPPQYSQREHSVLNSQGVEVQKHVAEMSPREAAEYAAKQREEARRKQHDMFLISTYPSVSEIENVRDARLTQIEGQITAAESYIAGLTTRIEGLKQRSLLFSPYNTRPGARRMPDDLAEEMVRAMSELRTQNAALAVKKKELDAVQGQFAEDIKRYRELRSASQARLNRTPAAKQ
jgi:hypothetical protein